MKKFTALALAVLPLLFTGCAGKPTVEVEIFAVGQVVVACINGQRPCDNAVNSDKPYSKKLTVKTGEHFTVAIGAGNVNPDFAGCSIKVDGKEVSSDTSFVREAECDWSQK